MSTNGAQIWSLMNGVETLYYYRVITGSNVVDRLGISIGDPRRVSWVSNEEFMFNKSPAANLGVGFEALRLKKR